MDFISLTRTGWKDSSVLGVGGLGFFFGGVSQAQEKNITVILDKKS